MSTPIDPLLAYVARLRTALLRYRLSPDHRDCQATGASDPRCVLCVYADDVLDQPLTLSPPAPSR